MSAETSAGTMPAAARKQSITKKLTRMNLLVSGAALVFACVAFFTYDWITFRERMVLNREIEARMIAANTTSAIVFNDPVSASNTLAAFRASPRVLFAAIYTANGKLFAAYWRDNGAANPPALPESTMRDAVRPVHLSKRGTRSCQARFFCRGSALARFTSGLICATWRIA